MDDKGSNYTKRSISGKQKTVVLSKYILTPFYEKRILVNEMFAILQYHLGK